MDLIVTGSDSRLCAVIMILACYTREFVNADVSVLLTSRVNNVGHGLHSDHRDNRGFRKSSSMHQLTYNLID